MNDEKNIPRQHPAAPYTATTVDQPTREQLFVSHQPTFRDVIYEQFPSLPFWEADGILNGLFRRLDRFICDSQEDFLIQAEQYVRHRSRHLALYLALTTDPQNVRAIESSIHANLYGSVLDCAISEEDLLQELRVYLYSRCWGLLPKKRDRAKVSTRLYSLTKKHLFFHNSKRFRRFNATTHAGDHLGVETLSPGELASVRTEEMEELAAD